MHQICKEGHAALLSDILKLVSQTLEISSILELHDRESQYTALHDAISYGNINCAVKLLQSGASLATPAVDGFTPLDIAVWNQFKNGFVPESKNLNVLTWGTNCNYNLGHNHDGNLKVPEKVKRFNREKFTSSICNVNFGKYHTLFLDKTGNVYSCGYGKGGRLGLGSENTFLEPTLIPGLKNIVKISCSNDHSLALSSDGKVYSWGINTHRVLGHPEPKNLSKPQVIKASFMFDKIITVKAAKYHSILVAADQIYTFGFNGGQIGHMFSEEEYQIVPRTVTRLRHKPGDNLGKIAHVHASAAATVVGFENGSIFVCNQYDIKKVATLNRFDHSNVLNFDASLKGASFASVKTKKIRVTGGSLARQVTSETSNKKPKALLLSILDTNGLVFCCIPEMFKNVLLYHWDVYNEKFLVSDIALGSNSLLLLTTNGEVFACDPYPTLKSDKEIRRDHSHKTWSSATTKKKESLQMLRPIKLAKQAGLHNGTKIVCNGTGYVNACIVQDRVSTLDFLPSVESSSFTSDISALYDNDEIYETDMTVYCQSGKRISAHKGLLANASQKLAKLVEDAETSGHDYIELSESDEIVASMLEIIYMINIPPTVKRQTMHPLLCNGMVDVNRCARIDRDAIINLSDVVLVSKEGVKFPCHRFVLAARVEYFMTHFMVNSRWGAVSFNQEIPVDANKRTLSDFIYYIYTDTFPSNYTFDSLKLLLRLADQYLVSRLKSFCEVSLVSYVTEENLIHMLRTANDYNSYNLRAVCLHIVAMNVPYYLEHRLLDNLEEEILEQLDKVYKEVVLFHLTRSPNKDYSVQQYLQYMVPVIRPVEVVEPTVKSPIKGLPDQLDEYVSDEEEGKLLKSDSGQQNENSSDASPSAAALPSNSSPEIPSTSASLTQNKNEDGALENAFREININKKLKDAMVNNTAETPAEAAGYLAADPIEPPLATSSNHIPKSWGVSNNGPATLNRSLSEIIAEEERQKQVEKKNKEAQRAQAKLAAQKSSAKTALPAADKSGVHSRPSSSCTPWGAVPEGPTVSLRDIMSTEDSTEGAKQKQTSPGKPLKSSPLYTSNPKSPLKSPEVRGKSETFNFAPDRQVHCLRSIMEAEQASSENVLPKSFSRPLDVIQIEERAIQELRELYKVDECCNEFITIRTVSGKNVARPAWGKNGPLNF